MIATEAALYGSINTSGSGVSTTAGLQLRPGDRRPHARALPAVRLLPDLSVPPIG